MSKKVRFCCSHKEWEEMCMEEKIEALGRWAVAMTEWAEETSEWQSGFHNSAKTIITAIKEFSDKEDGGGIPPKHPKDPGC